ncbi:phage tail protein [Taibaiella soli]|uniref:Phage tail protein n=1 Tax=Taibaiella soli TaxID=1649169 RepID=A0A2W2AQR0_9BACT|nr:phage tail protein [Taibaiella soli]PZF74750.1 phage tail protein [Taibaiella soli]
MATDSNNAAGATWPMPKFRFEVDFGTELKGIIFQEISGMDVEAQIIEYRKTDNPVFSTEKMPGITKHGNITMKKGMFANDNNFWDWYQQITMNSIQRRTVVIRLLDEQGNATMQWQLDNAWPTKTSSTDLGSEGNEVAVESLEVAYETLVITAGK